MGGDPPVRGGPTGGPNADPPWARRRGNVPLPVALPQVKPALTAAKPPVARRKRSWLGRAVLALLLSAGMWCLYQYATLPDAGSLSDRNPEDTSLMRAREEAARSEGKRPRRRQYWVPLGAIAPRAVDAVITSEDSSFYAHHGIDYDELKIVLEKAWQKRSLGRGASTITQQLAKNLWLSGERSLIRKAKEVLLARRLENALPKKRILALYLNVVEWGDGIYGIEAGAREHFGISASELSIAQGAILAAMLPAPRRWTPASRSRPLHKRALWIVDHFEQSGRISPDEGSAARGEIERMFAKDRGAPEPPDEPDEPPEDEQL